MRSIDDTERVALALPPPGTGKTYHTVARAVALWGGTSDDELAAQYPPHKRAELRAKFEEYRKAQRIGFVTFHQTFTYEDFVEGIKPLSPTTGVDVELSVDDDSNATQAGAVQHAGAYFGRCATPPPMPCPATTRSY